MTDYQNYPPLQAHILQELSQVPDASIPELARLFDRSRADILYAILYLNTTGKIRQVLPGRYALVREQISNKEATP